MMETNGNGSHSWSFWWKLGSVGVGIGAALFGMVSGFMRIDARLETHGKLLETLAVSVKQLSDRSASLDAVDAKIERACLQMALANNGRFACPFSVGPPPVVKRAVAKRSPSVTSKQ